MIPKPVRIFNSVPSLPPVLARLQELAYNVRWAWDEDTRAIFQRLDEELWRSSGHNPVWMLSQVPSKRWKELAEDGDFVEHLRAVCASFDTYMQADSTWYSRTHTSNGLLAAYFSAEFGITECLKIFAGGLGVLAGDHLKSASDLGIPIVGVGLMYQQGYFSQSLDAHGWQQESYVENDFVNLPLILEHQPDGLPHQVEVTIGERIVYARIWRVQVGRIPLYLLDTNFNANTEEEDRNLTDYLYGGGNELRIRQEIMLGIGGYRALQKLGLTPKVFHVNEGHSAFLTLERTRQIMQEYHLSFEEARTATAASVIFTTHTPVEAGHDRFSPELMERYLVSYAKESLGLDGREFLALGREHKESDTEFFGMTKLALRMSSACNGVARLHGEVSRSMWQNLWPTVPQDEVPINHVTNGIHISSWISSSLKQHVDHHVGPQWREEAISGSRWKQIEQVPDDVLWQTHLASKEQLILHARSSLKSRLLRLEAPAGDIAQAESVLDPSALTIGFARRFATYKRASLLMQDLERLTKILTNTARPVQIIFSGKAHPRDQPGKQLIQKIAVAAQTAPLHNHIVFLEDYDMRIARILVQGVDLWLNTPRRPREASGTSGMKAAANGGLNLSILDGWWEEGYDPTIGWAIGSREMMENHSYQDERDAEHLYDQLENAIVPLFYERSPEGIPTQWIARMKRSISAHSSFFNTHRMVQEYTENAYLTAAARVKTLYAENLKGVRELTHRHQRAQKSWSKIKVYVHGDAPQDLQVGDTFTVNAKVTLGDLSPEDVEVQVYLGQVTNNGEITDAKIIPMKQVRDSESQYLYQAADITCDQSGPVGYTVRILPKHSGQTQLKMVWAQ